MARSRCDPFRLRFIGLFLPATGYGQLLTMLDRLRDTFIQRAHSLSVEDPELAQLLPAHGWRLLRGEMDTVGQINRVLPHSSRRFGPQEARLSGHWRLNALTQPDPRLFRRVRHTLPAISRVCKPCPLAAQLGDPKPFTIRGSMRIDTFDHSQHRLQRLEKKLSDPSTLVGTTTGTGFSDVSAQTTTQISVRDLPHIPGLARTRICQGIHVGPALPRKEWNRHHAQ